MSGDLIYLASPYTDNRPSMVEWRYKKNKRALRELTGLGYTVFAPVVVGHQLHKEGLDRDWAWWMQWSQVFLARSTRCFVLTLPGWENSKGVRAEVDYCVEHKIPVVGCDILPDCIPTTGFDLLGVFGYKGLSW